MATIINESLQSNFEEEGEGEIYDAPPQVLELDNR